MLPVLRGSGVTPSETVLRYGVLRVRLQSCRYFGSCP